MDENAPFPRDPAQATSPSPSAMLEECFEPPCMRALFEESMDAVLLTSPDGSVYRANPAATAMFGLTEEEVCARGRTGLVDLDDPRLPVLLAERESAGRAWGELRMRRGDGSLFEADLSSSVYLDDQGRRRTVMVIRDVSRRRKAQADRERLDNALQFLATSGWDLSGGSFLDDLAGYLSVALGMEWVHIGVLQDHGTRARSLTLYGGGRFHEERLFDLEGTPCHEAVGRYVCRHDANVREYYPDSAFLKALDAESYLGVTLYSSSGEPIGIIACTGLAPLADGAMCERILRIAAIRAAGELERKLIRDELDRSRGLLEKALEEKTTLMKEVHHRVKNNLQILMSLVSLQAESLGEGAESGALDAMRSRIRSISLVHDKLHKGREQELVGMRGYLGDLVSQIGKASGESGRLVLLELDLEDILLDQGRAVPLGLLVNELVTNAYKHAFAPGRPGRLAVSLRRGEGRCALTVKDDGRGLPPAFDLSGQATLGMQLVAALAGQLGGTVRAKILASGALFEVEFPLEGQGLGEAG